MSDSPLPDEAALEKAPTQAKDGDLAVLGEVAKSVELEEIEPLDLTTPVVRLEIQSPLEEGLEMVGFVGLMALFFGGLGMLVSEYGMYLAMAGAPLFGTGFWARMVTDCRYELDNQSRTLNYRRGFLGLSRAQEVCRAEDIAIVTVRGESTKIEEDSYVWSYTTLLMLEDGTSIPIGVKTNNLAGLNRLSGDLATHLGARLVPGREEQILEHVPESKMPEVIRTQSLKGAGAEHLVGDGLFTMAVGYLMALPAILLPGLATLGELDALMYGGGSLMALSGYLALTLVLGFLGFPLIFSGSRLLFAGFRRVASQEEARQIENDHFMSGMDMMLVLLLLNLTFTGVLGLLSLVGVEAAAFATGLHLAGSWGLANAGALVAYSFTGLSFLTEESSPQSLAEPVRVHLLGRLERNQPRCGYCGGTILPEHVLACNTCEALHHHECWDEFGACTTYGCGSRAASPVA